MPHCVMFMHMSCPKLGISLGISNVQIDEQMIDIDTSHLIVGVRFLYTYVMPRVGDVVTKPDASLLKEGALKCSFDGSPEKVVVVFEGDSPTGQYVITMCHYFDHNGPNVKKYTNLRFYCVATPI